MKVYISADIEGVTGLVSWSQCGRPNSEHFDYKWAREMMTHDVNAAIRGVRAGGATEVVVKDSHGNSKNLILSELDPGVQLISGHGSGTDGMMQGIDSSFDCAMLIGYHAMAGTALGVMEHTISGRVHRMWINELPAGEMALSAGVAGRYRVPVIMVSSDAAGCAEASSFLPFVQTATVKTGVGRYMAQCQHPSVTEKLITDGARESLKRVHSIQPWLPEEPTTIRLEFNRSEECDYAVRVVGSKRVDAFTVEYRGSSYQEAHQAAWNLISMAGLGGQMGD